MKEIAELFPDNEEGLSTVQVVNRLLGWLKKSPGILLSLVRPENISELLGSQYDALETDDERGAFALPVIETFLSLWLKGKPLCELEATHSKPDKVRCKHARHFALRLVPDIAFVAGLVARVMTARNEGSEVPHLPAVIETLASAVKEGCDSPEALAVRLKLGRSVSRPHARRRFEQLQPYFPASKPMESFKVTQQRCRDALTLEAFSLNPIG